MSSPPKSAEATLESPSSDKIRNNDHQILMIYRLEGESIISDDWSQKATAIFKQGDATHLSKAINELIHDGEELVSGVAGGILIEKALPYIEIEKVVFEGKGRVLYDISLPMEHHDDFLELANTKDFEEKFQSRSNTVDKHVQEKVGNEAVHDGILGILKKFSIILVDPFTCKIGTPPLSCYYRMDSSKRGKLIIFNQVNFSKESHLEKRIGSDKDQNSLEITFGQLGFEVESYKDQTKKEVLDKIAELAGQDYSGYNCFACAVLTHGGENGTLWARDSIYNIKELQEPFRSHPSLIGKPKLFFIQACRGNQGDPGGVQKDTDPFKENICFSIPIEADFLISHSSTDGYFSYRPEDGSWYIQTLTECLQEHKTLELTQILTLVTRKVCKMVLQVELQNEKHQVPCFESRLTGFFYFYGKKKTHPILEITEPETPKTVNELRTEYWEKKYRMTKKRNIEDREMMKQKEKICKMKVERSRAAED